MRNCNLWAKPQQIMFGFWSVQEYSFQTLYVTFEYIYPLQMDNKKRSPLLSLSEDVIIYICSFLEPLDLCRLGVLSSKLSFSSTTSFAPGRGSLSYIVPNRSFSFLFREGAVPLPLIRLKSLVAGKEHECFLEVPLPGSRSIAS